MKIVSRVLAVGITAVLLGCASVTVLDQPTAGRTPAGLEIVETVAVDNTDWKLLCLLPIASGDPSRPNVRTCRWFRDTVNVQNQLDMLETEVRRVGGSKAVDVVSLETEEDYFLVLFLRRKLHTTATIVR